MLRLPALLLFLLVQIVTLTAQLSIDFSSADLSNWQGDLDKFEVNTSQQLQLNDVSQSSPAQLFYPISIQGATVWEGYISYDFSPSTSNFADFVLSSDQSDRELFNGYFIRIGGISGNEDALTLYRQDGDASIVLLSGTVGAVGGSRVQVRIRISRDEDAIWTLEADYTGARDFQEEGSVFDATYDVGLYFGIFCRYTSTRSDKLFFDDFVVNTTRDTSAPELLSVSVLSSTTVQLTFNEPLAIETATAIDNYTIDPIIAVSRAQLINNQLINDQVVELELASPLLPNQPYLISIENVTDQAGNAILPTSSEFIFIPPVDIEFGDIVITEIMADPSPSVGLPEIEYIELYNRSDKVIDLAKLQLVDERETIALPSFQLPSDAYVMIYEGEDRDFPFVQNRLALTNFLSLGNSADQVRLLDGEQLIHEVIYDRSWYQNNNKDDGGWSLEWRQPNFICDLSSLFWGASEAAVGGTPGAVNVEQMDRMDTGFLAVQRIEVLDNQTLRLIFLERILLDENNIKDNLIINDNQIESVDIEAIPSRLLVRLSDPLVKDVSYELTVGQGFTDCLSNTFVREQKLNFELPEAIMPLDIVINEILFNPSTGGSDYIELYNRSDKTVDLSTLFIADQELETIIPIETAFLLPPDSYVVFTESPAAVRLQYSSTQINSVVETDLPNLPNDEGDITIYRLDDNNQIVEIDAFAYSEDFHNPLLDDVDGVSLERVQTTAPTQDANNWQSTASTAGFGTPTAQNSQLFEPSILLPSRFQLADDQISPDGDGFQDLLLIEYELDSSGFAANIRLFDAAGRYVTDLAKGELLAAKGTYIWNGTNEGEAVPPGIYILQIDYFEANGESRREQLTFSVARQF
ncbi:MAG: lamin tail domain-containing protein [Bacteroidota bacterium]